MSTRAKDPDTKCHLFRLPPELRVVIYDLVLENLGFAGLDEDVLEEEESDDGDHLEEEDEAESVGTSEGVDGVEGIDIELGEESEENDDEDETPRYSPRLSRPPLLDVCKLVRREAAPMYNSRLTLIAIEILEESARVLGAELDVDDGYEDSKWLAEVLLDDVSGLWFGLAGAWMPWRRR
ncbi:hypothetical protein M409DRAFT_59043 [Zasmidium cellare ATCC 36951]|uniref:F-box domain-containing protein n=1 Tax=Zasmidium cellare ATCC 36951 TaxID=1080233 RepID=A0A6A6C408_ZASCE|nr:uncharacterized protein M409DRAFT_59043 [Zasmidium cellare ATCC 36951]KAF2161663.1 hypothetical protein M409DRAFT_59043 [Zasmidium cellare ATCC 36951]